MRGGFLLIALKRGTWSRRKLKAFLRWSRRFLSESLCSRLRIGLGDVLLLQFGDDDDGDDADDDDDEDDEDELIVSGEVLQDVSVELLLTLGMIVVRCELAEVIVVWPADRCLQDAAAADTRAAAAEVLVDVDLIWFWSADVVSAFEAVTVAEGVADDDNDAATADGDKDSGGWVLLESLLLLLLIILLLLFVINWLEPIDVPIGLVIELLIEILLLLLLLGAIIVVLVLVFVDAVVVDDASVVADDCWVLQFKSSTLRSGDSFATW